MSDLVAELWCALLTTPLLHCRIFELVYAESTAILLPLREKKKNNLFDWLTSFDHALTLKVVMLRLIPRFITSRGAEPDITEINTSRNI